MHLVSNLPHHVAPHEWILGEEMTPADPGLRSLDEAAIFPAVREADLIEDGPAPLRLPVTPWHPPGRAAPGGRWRLTAVASVAALAVLSVGTWIKLHTPPRVALVPVPVPMPVPAPAPKPAPAPVLPPIVRIAPKAPARLVATAAVAWADGGGIRPGTDLWTGRTLRLTSGAVEVQLSTGVRLIVEGPAAFHLTGGNEVALDYGKLVARVPHETSASGFAVLFDNQRVTDLGTEFGLSAPAPTADHTQATVSVFDGTVRLDPAAGSTATSRPAPIVLTQGHAVASGDAGHGWTAVVPTAVQFARSLTDVRVPLAVASTGVGLNVGQRDPNWQVFEVSRGEGTPQPLFVVPAAWWAENDPARSQWLTTTPNSENAPFGLFVVRTTVDLTGVDPATAVVQAGVMVDDTIEDVRINGISKHLTVPVSPQRLNWRRLHPMTLQGGFKTGKNLIDFVVFNSGSPGHLTKMGFRAEMHGQAMPVVVR
jgi:hypothetical protein